MMSIFLFSWFFCGTFLWVEVARSLPILTVGAFNVRNFGEKKMENDTVVDVIVQIVSQYDIILIQEIVGPENKTANLLLERLNRFHEKNLFDVVASPRVGRTTAKEQYAYIFRTDKLRLSKSYIYSDNNDIYEREPFIATFLSRSRAKGLTNFTLVGIHIKPSSAVSELQSLHKVVEKVVERDTKNVILLGDFNADCSFVAKKYWSTISLWTNPKYLWCISNNQDTTTTPSNCAYDRIVLRGEAVQRALVKGSNRTVEFDLELELTNELTLAVSDHYPVQIQLDLSLSRQNRQLNKSTQDSGIVYN